MKILIIEDQFEAASNYRQYLETKDYICDIESSVANSIKLLKENKNQYDLIILDLNLDDGHGSEIVRYVKDNNLNIFILVVSANAEDVSVVDLITLGADDYIIKPVNLEILLVKIKALLRSKYDVINNEIVFGEFKYSKDRKTLFIDGEEIMLSKKELLIAEYLIINHDQLITTEMLSNAVYDKYYDESSAALRVQIHNIKKKLNKKHEIFVSYHKKGYKLLLNQFL